MTLMFYEDYDEEKKKRLRMLERLTKKQQMQLYTEVIGFIERYNVLVAAFETITAVIRELEYHQSSIISQGGVKLPRTKKRNLIKLGIPEYFAHMAANSRKGYWRTSNTSTVKRALSKERLIQSGFYDLAIAYQSLHVNC